MTPFAHPETVAAIRAVLNCGMACSPVVSHLPDGTRVRLAGFRLEVPERTDQDTGVKKLAGVTTLHLLWEPAE